MTLWQLLLMAKETEKLHDDGLITISAATPEVLLTERAFTEIFPVGWHDDPPFTDGAGQIIRIRSIRLDGVTFACVKKVE